MDSLQPEDPSSTQELPLQTPVQPQIRWGQMLLDILETVVLAVVLFLGINAISARVRVDGSSMLPTLHNGEFVLVNRLAYRTGQVQRGDIIDSLLPLMNCFFGSKSCKTFFRASHYTQR